jgi:hypothetical protein
MAENQEKYHVFHEYGLGGPDSLKLSQYFYDATSIENRFSYLICCYFQQVASHTKQETPFHLFYSVVMLVM